MTKFESKIQTMNREVNEAYALLSDLNNLSKVRERLQDPAFMEMAGSQVPQDKLEQAKQQLESMQFDADSITMQSPMGPISLRVIEREAPKLVKLQAENTPVNACLWIQLLPHDENTSLLKVTIGAELNIFIKAMASKPLQQAADGLAQMLSIV